jgi:hypothetical protein
MINQTVNAACDAKNKMGEAIGATLGLPYTANLNNGELLKMLAVCAEECYFLNENDDNLKNYGLSLIDYQTENLGTTTGIQWGLYKINSSGSLILAFRGTDSIKTGIQDVDLFTGISAYIRTIIKIASDTARNKKANYICGHSLGGLIAEATCSWTGIGGASFNAPGPWSSVSINNLAEGNNYNGVPFEVHLTKNDAISYFGSAGGPSSSHIGKPIWHDHNGAHSMKAIREDIERNY